MKKTRKECSRLFWAYQEGKITWDEFERRLKALERKLKAQRKPGRKKKVSPAIAAGSRRKAKREIVNV